MGTLKTTLPMLIIIIINSPFYKIIEALVANPNGHLISLPWPVPAQSKWELNPNSVLINEVNQTKH